MAKAVNNRISSGRPNEEELNEERPNEGRLTEARLNLGLSRQDYDLMLIEARNPQSLHYQGLWYRLYKDNFQWLERWLTTSIANGDSRYAEDAVQNAFLAFDKKLRTPPPIEYYGLSKYIKVAAERLLIRWRTGGVGGFDDLDDGTANGLAEDFNKLQNKIEDEVLMQEAFDKAVEFLQRAGSISIEDWWILTAKLHWNMDSKDIAKALLPLDTNYETELGKGELKRKDDAVRRRISTKRTLLIEKTRELYKTKNDLSND